MITPPHRNTGNPNHAGRASHATHPPLAEVVHARSASCPSAVQDRRYPSLSDDGQPWFPRYTYVRILALLGIIALVTCLALTAQP
jgi:hypothetical protein